MAKKKAEKQPVAQVEAVPVEAAPIAVVRTDGAGDKGCVVYLESGDSPTPVQHSHPRDFQIYVHGCAYFHVADHTDGAWIYRKA